MTHQIDTIILKFAAGCNLLCDYCYEYTSGDDTWKKKPKLLSEEYSRQVGLRIKEYLETSPRQSITVVAHGGEPLLMGPKKLKRVFNALIEGSGSDAVKLIIQTNGVLINEEVCEIVKEKNIKVGISIDGNENHNKLRVDHKGRPSYQATIDGINMMRSICPEQYSGLIAVVDFNQEPKEVMHALLEHAPPVLDLLQPFVTHDMLVDKKNALTVEKFGNWMVRATNYWMDNKKYHKTRIRFIEDAIKAVLGYPPKSDWFGTRDISYLIIETDGTYDLQDQLKVVGSDSLDVRKLNKNIFNNKMSEAERAANSLLVSLDGDKLPEKCIGCHLENKCSGGFLPTRYSTINKFDNPSVYCNGIKQFLGMLNEKVESMGQSQFI